MNNDQQIINELQNLRREVLELKTRLPKKRIPMIHPMDVIYMIIAGKIEGRDYIVGVGTP